MEQSDELNPNEVFVLPVQRQPVSKPSADVELSTLGVSLRVRECRGGSVKAHSQQVDAAVHITGRDGSAEAFLSFAPGVGERSLDPVMAKLSEALAAAEGDASKFAGLYADAIRLAITLRKIGLRAEDSVEPPARADAGGLSKWRLKLVTRYIADHLDQRITLADMAGAARLSSMHFAAQFLRATGMRPHHYLLTERIRAAQQMLLTSDKSIVQISLAVGFQTQAHFTTVFKRIAGMTPAKWREQSRSGERTVTDAAE